MMDQDNGKLRSVAWSEICPWLMIFRTFRLAIQFRFLLLSAVGVLLMVAGWALLGCVFSGDPQVAGQIQQVVPKENCPLVSIANAVPDRPAWPDGQSIGTACEQIAQPVRLLSLPFRKMFFPGAIATDVDYWAYWVLCGLWSLVVWAVLGGAITRTAAVRLAADERVSWWAMISHVKSRCLAYFGAPLFPLCGVLLATLPILLFGLLLRTGPSLWISALVWPLLLLDGLFIAILLLGLLFGWPLMWATISTEGTDAFDALSRAYAYVFQRPLRYLFYVAVAAAFGILGWLLVSNFAAGVVHMTYWAASWGSGQEQIEAITLGDKELLGGTGAAGAVLIRFWVDCVKLLAVGFLYSYFWTASTAVYLLLRHDVDATEMDEVYLEDEQEEESSGLPPLGTDEAGAPVAADESPDESPDESQPPADDQGDDAQDQQP